MASQTFSRGCPEVAEPRRSGVTDSAQHVVGTIVEALPSALYRVQLADGHHVLAHLAASLRMTYIRALPGDRVRLEISPYDRSRARIVAQIDRG